MRPETFAVDLFAIELLLLAGRGSVFWIVPAVVLWANLHASVAFAPVCALVFGTVQALATRAIGPAVKRSFSIAGLAAIASLATPFGLRLWKYAFDLSIAPSPVRQHLDVWKPLSFDVVGSVTSLLPGILILICCGIVFRKARAGHIAVAALCFVLTLAHARYGLFLVVAWSPLIARALEMRTRLSAFAMPGAPVRRSWAFPVAIAPLAIFALFHGATAARAAVDPPGDWRAGATLVEEHHLSGNTYAPYEWAAYLHWRDLPVRLLIDAHGDPYPKDVWADHLALLGVHPGWRDVLARRHIGVVIMPVDSPLAQAMSLNPSWRTVGTLDKIVAYESRVQPPPSVAAAGVPAAREQAAR
jgi:hypothetical protein